ncbi:MAG: M23 family metallopeptidase [Ignavibacteriales bacterium]
MKGVNAISKRAAWIIALLALFGASAAAGVAVQRSGMRPGGEPATSAPMGTARPEDAGGAAAPAPRPVAVVSAAPSKVPQGGLLCVTIRDLPASTEVTVEVFGAKRKAFVSGDSARLFVPVDVKQPPGVHMANAECGDAGVIPAFFTVLETDFPSSRITVTRETEQLTQDQARIQKDQALVRAGKSSTHRAPYWLEPFSKPVDAPVSTPFGYTRYVNGRESGRHWGIDFAAEAGTPVTAANAGKVVVAANLLLSGNTVVVDHGLNLFTSYLHMKDMKVKEGDLIEKGAVIGHVGSTGFSTGPHLHWSASCGLDSFDPSALLTVSP